MRPKSRMSPPGRCGEPRRPQPWRASACDALLMFRIPLLQTLYTTTDDRTEYQTAIPATDKRLASRSLKSIADPSQTSMPA